MASILYKKIKSPPKPISPCAHSAGEMNPFAATSNLDAGAAGLSPNSQMPAQKTQTLRKCPQCAQEKKAANVYRWKLILGLLPAYFLASLDLTIVATALPFIASHFNKLNQLNWIVTAFTLTSTTFILAFGQLADVFGRHATFHFALFWMTIGSVLCAAAVTWPMLLLGRAFQGISAAGIQNLSMIILADNVSLKEQAKTMSIFQLVIGIGYSVGPIIGGYITNVNWRYCFVISCGLPLISHIAVFFLLRKELQKGTFSLSQHGSRLNALWAGLSTLDIGGMIIFILGTGLIILGTAWGGSTYPWDSAAVIVSLILGIVLFISFFYWEYLLEPGHLLSRVFPKTKPMLPYYLFRYRDVGLVAIIQTATGTAIYSVFYFIGIFFTLALGYGPSKAGIQLLYYIPGIGVGVYSAILLCNWRPKQTFWPLFIGTVIETVGIAVITYAVKIRNPSLVNGMMVVAGAGTGLRFMPLNLHLAGIYPDQIAAAYSLVRFVLPFGGTLALTIMGSVFQNKMARFFGSAVVKSAIGGGAAGGGIGPSTQGGLQAINDLPPAQRMAVRQAGADATTWAFVSILPILGLSVVAGCLLGNVSIGQRMHSPAPGAAEKDAAAASPVGGVKEVQRSLVCERVYLLALIRRRVPWTERTVTIASSAGKDRRGGAAGRA